MRFNLLVGPRTGLFVLGGLIGLATGCGPEPDVPEPAKGAAPDVERPVPDGAPMLERPQRADDGTPCRVDPELVYPAKLVASPIAVEATERDERVRALMERVVAEHGTAADNPWAVGHAMLALGPDVTLSNGQPAVDWLFSEYAEYQDVGGVAGVAFPAKRGLVRIEPHTDLLLKAVTEGGVKPERPVKVEGRDVTVADLYKRSLCAAWVDGDKTAFGSWNDTPWSLQGLAHWSPAGLSWTADGGHAMTMDGLTSAVVDKLQSETAFLREAKRAGTQVQKRKQGVFSYTCGGAHLIQGAVWAVGRGHGRPSDKATVAAEVSTYLERMDLELRSVDDNLPKAPEWADLLLIQRVKYLGHLLETAHKAAALGVWTPTDAERKELDRAADELAQTVFKIEEQGWLKDMERLRKKREQTYLDYIGDFAHALRGLDLHTGKGMVRI